MSKVPEAPPEAFPIMPANGEERRLLAEGKLRGFIPWGMIAPHEVQARRNHHQTLETLARRGGLDACEAVCVLRDESWWPGGMNLATAREQLDELVRIYLDHQVFNLVHGVKP